MAASHDATSELIRSLARDNIQRLQIPQVLSAILDSRYYKDSIQQLPGQDLGMWVKRLGEVYRLRTPLSYATAYPLPDR